METSTLQVNGLAKRLKRFTLGPLDFEVKRGLVIGLVGANGSGKSTFFRLLMNIIKADSGTVRVLGQDWCENEDDWKKKVGYAGELLEAYDFLTIRKMKHLISKWYPTWNESRFNDLVKRYKVELDKKYGKCSKGTKKKVEFIFSICHQPTLLLLDEPTAGVDLVSQRKMKEDLIRFMEDGDRSIVLATHTVEEINQLCDEIVVLDEGRILYSFNKDEIYDQWARIWISHLTETISNHPNVIRFEATPLQLVTNQLETLEKILEAEKVTLHHVQRLSVEEVLELVTDQE